MGWLKMIQSHTKNMTYEELGYKAAFIAGA